MPSKRSITVNGLPIHQGSKKAHSPMTDPQPGDVVSPNERSAEWLRGRLSAMRDYEWAFSPDTITREVQLLAAAEAREATQPTPLKRGKPMECTCLGPDPCTCAGPTAADRPPLGCPLNAAIELANKLAQQKIAAAEVIEACRVALERCGPCEETITMPEILHGERLRVGALELCAR